LVSGAERVQDPDVSDILKIQVDLTVASCLQWTFVVASVIIRVTRT